MYKGDNKVAESKNKTLHYKRASFMSGANDLQACLETAYKKNKKAVTRKETINASEHTYRLWNSKSNVGQMIFGNLVIYAEDKDQPLITPDNAVDEFELSKLIPPIKNGKKQEFLESIMHFGVLNNHIVILQSSALRARDLELYFNWFLRECAKIIDKEDGIFINDHPTKKTLSKVAKQPVKKVSIGAPLSTETIIEPEQDEDIKAKKIYQYVPVGMGFNVIKAALGEEWMKNVNLKDSLDEANLQVKLEISYFRKTSSNAHKLLNNIATSLRHTEPDDVTILLEGGGKLKGSDLKLFHDINIGVINGMVDSSDLYDQMRQWLTNLIKQKTIDP